MLDGAHFKSFQLCEQVTGTPWPTFTRQHQDPQVGNTWAETCEGINAGWTMSTLVGHFRSAFAAEKWSVLCMEILEPQGCPKYPKIPRLKHAEMWFAIQIEVDVFEAIQGVYPIMTAQ